ncbi:hypothetical protein PSTEL_01320 [Paenibacillus stellifer]|uniref:Uncharacterized protein n=2 Tax=Paenibacillus stellifer TaxID=169760 RepID=A0A089LKC3_9BACL|nr:hypothetical protein PSTEL_01320 [Paenibacillus stellifer]
MGGIIVSRKQTHKKSKREFLMKLIFGFIWNRILWGVIISAFINLAMYSYITNSYMTYIVTEERLQNIIVRTIITIYGIDSVENVKFFIDTEDVMKENEGLILAFSIIPEGSDIKSGDYKVEIMNEEMDLSNVRLNISNYLNNTVGINIYNRETNKLVNNMYSVRFTERQDKQIREVLNTESRSKTAKWFLETFK